MSVKLKPGQIFERKVKSSMYRNFVLITGVFHPSRKLVFGIYSEDGKSFEDCSANMYVEEMFDQRRWSFVSEFPLEEVK
jgi:hypothetical protein